ncbi:hypothetical protein CEP52_015965 [Fusarium oligoseptatum]|uniref:Uncharacterized protein n=1 Tax=Fusarium oligoseptatum TaxID=2604345 RepID=A0A428S848_9HYPO|nr:hypothetical protein CEP52_015965 [Fusarium oligoseptatum]
MTRRTDREPRVRRSCERCRPLSKIHVFLGLTMSKKTEGSLRQQLSKSIQQFTSPGCRAIYRRSEQPRTKRPATTSQFTSFSANSFINDHRPIYMVAGKP